MTTLTFLAASLILGLAWGNQEPSARSELAHAVNHFSQDLYQQIGTEDKDVIYSPYSIHSALSMTSLGAHGDTLKEMQKTLGISSITDPHGVYKDVILQLNSAKKVTLDIANGIFTNLNIPLKRKFEKAVTNNYYAVAENFDLRAKAGPEKKINDFVAQKTNGVIQNLLPKDSINSGTASVLVNTVFFNGTWVSKFDKRWTTKKDFHKLDGSLTKVDMMQSRDPLSVKLLRDDTNGLDMVAIPFKGWDFCLSIVMPRNKESMEKLESDPAKMQQLSDRLSSLDSLLADVQIPKFKIETELKLVPVLKKMGIEKAFKEDKADFSGMSDTPAYIGKVIHKAVIDVQEEGTVAAAATAVVGILKLAAYIPQDTFIADRPFLFFLKEKTTNQILFQGKFTGN